MPALPFPMVGRIAEQTLEQSTYPYGTETQPTAHGFLPIPFCRRTQTTQPVIGIGTTISPVLSSFRILLAATGVYRSIFPTCRSSDFQTYQRVCLQGLAASLASVSSSHPLFSMACSLFLQNTRVGGRSLPFFILPTFRHFGVLLSPPPSQCVLNSSLRFSEAA
jgi:hypothetical protein